ncbi:S-methyl-5-thioribose-1-phosphate isomerase [Salinibius halmophilus]|uniref:S-methyl-5-thioribose-1-phosphate isomerase n=1 Tax=Salinibius halmophilus TaxID=1853216 RepID=UPI000E664FA7|nr:S-methyl-5-thioribose-1-phosphate isomerase [Salinibius halmophilus]
MNQLSAIQYHNQQLSLLDQRLLPKQEKWLQITNSQACAQAIKDMVVRGAPAIAIAAGFALAMDAKNGASQAALLSACDTLAASRPTAVNLFWALKILRPLIESSASATDIERCAWQIANDDEAACEAMAQFGAGLIAPNSAVMTHCNTGSLATAGLGTALGVIKRAHEDNKISRVFANETRPWMQGARLTAWELNKAGVPVSLNADSAAALLIKKHHIQWFIVGADRIAANGDVANKVGTFAVALQAKQLGCKVMVVAPSTTFDLTLKSGDDIEIESRPGSEFEQFSASNTIAPGVRIENPVFDVTPAELIDVIVCEHGVIKSPNEVVIAKCLLNL